MNVKFNQHIGIFENAQPNAWCDDIINLYNNNLESAHSRNFLEKDIDVTMKKDTIFLEEKVPINIINNFSDFLLDGPLVLYDQRYAFSNANGNFIPQGFKLQKTLPAEGYHLWHYENSGIEVIDRILTWMIYLNDIEEGGETEFLHQSLRVKPKKGTLLIWPASFTHLHRGNPPLLGEKYAVTGWIHLIKKI